MLEINLNTKVDINPNLKKFQTISENILKFKKHINNDLHQYKHTNKLNLQLSLQKIYDKYPTDKLRESSKEIKMNNTNELISFPILNEKKIKLQIPPIISHIIGEFKQNLPNSIGKKEILISSSSASANKKLINEKKQKSDTSVINHHSNKGYASNSETSYKKSFKNKYKMSKSLENWIKHLSDEESIKKEITSPYLFTKNINKKISNLNKTNTFNFKAHKNINLTLSQKESITSNKEEKIIAQSPQLNTLNNSLNINAAEQASSSDSQETNEEFLKIRSRYKSIKNMSKLNLINTGLDNFTMNKILSRNKLGNLNHNNFSTLSSQGGYTNTNNTNNINSSFNSFNDKKKNYFLQSIGLKNNNSVLTKKNYTFFNGETPLRSSFISNSEDDTSKNRIVSIVNNVNNPTKDSKIEVNINQFDIKVIHNNLGDLLDECSDINSSIVKISKKLISQLNKSDTFKDKIIKFNNNNILDPKEQIENAKKLHKKLKTMKINLKLKKEQEMEYKKENGYNNFDNEGQFKRKYEEDEEILTQTKNNKCKLIEISNFEVDSNKNISKPFTGNNSYQINISSDYNNNLKDKADELKENTNQVELEDNNKNDEYSEENINYIDLKIKFILNEIIENYDENKIVFFMSNCKRENLSLDQNGLNKISNNFKDKLILKLNFKKNRFKSYSHLNKYNTEKYFNKDDIISSIEYNDLIKQNKFECNLNKLKEYISKQYKTIKKGFLVNNYKDNLLSRSYEHIINKLSLQIIEKNNKLSKIKTHEFYKLGFRDLILSELNNEKVNHIMESNLIKPNYNFNESMLSYIALMRKYILESYYNYYKTAIKALYVRSFQQNDLANIRSPLLTFKTKFFENEFKFSILNEMLKNRKKNIINKKDLNKTSKENIQTDLMFKKLDHLQNKNFNEDEEILNNFKNSFIVENEKKYIKNQSKWNDVISEVDSNGTSLDEKDKKHKFKRKTKRTQFKNKIKLDESINIISEKIMPKYSLLNNQNYFNQQRKIDISPLVINFSKKIVLDLANLKSFKMTSINCSLDKENFTHRTSEIKEHIVKKIPSLFETLKFHILDKNEVKFKELYMKTRINPDESDKQGNTLLNLAVQSNNIDTASLLIDMNSTVNTQNKLMNTPLHYALSKNNYKIANILLKRKASETLENSMGLTPWQCIGLCLD